MKKPTSDIIVEVGFYATNEGGRETVTPRDKFGCLFEFDGRIFDCRLLLDNVGSIAPGQTVRVPIKFLSPFSLKHKLHVGDKFRLREARDIAEGHVCEVLFDFR